jgi:hypothetical protein
MSGLKARTYLRSKNNSLDAEDKTSVKVNLAIGTSMQMQKALADQQ